MNIFQEINDFLNEYLTETEYKGSYCILTFFDERKNISLFFCKKLNGYEVCSGHLAFCSLEEAKKKSIYDLCKLKDFLSTKGIKLIVDFEWFSTKTINI